MLVGPSLVVLLHRPGQLPTVGLGSILVDDDGMVVSCVSLKAKLRFAVLGGNAGIGLGDASASQDKNRGNCDGGKRAAIGVGDCIGTMARSLAG